MGKSNSKSYNIDVKEKKADEYTYPRDVPFQCKDSGIEVIENDQTFQFNPGFLNYNRNENTGLNEVILLDFLKYYQRTTIKRYNLTPDLQTKIKMKIRDMTK